MKVTFFSVIIVHTYQSLTFDSDTKASISRCILAQYVGGRVTKSYFDHINFQAKLQETLVLLISSESASVGVNIYVTFSTEVQQQIFKERFSFASLEVKKCFRSKVMPIRG